MSIGRPTSRTETHHSLPYRWPITILHVHHTICGICEYYTTVCLYFEPWKGMRGIQLAYLFLRLNKGRFWKTLKWNYEIRFYPFENNSKKAMYGKQYRWRMVFSWKEIKETEKITFPAQVKSMFLANPSGWVIYMYV